MKTIAMVAAGALLAALSLPTQAALLSVGDVSVPEGTASVNVPIMLSGGENISALSVAFAVGDGGSVLGGVDNVPITGVTTAGGVFAAFSHDTSANPGLPASSATVIDISILTANANAAANGLGLTVTLDTSNLHAGDSFTLAATTTVLPSTASNSSGNAVALTEKDGTLNITAAAVPEPATLGLLGLATVGLLRRRERRV